MLRKVLSLTLFFGLIMVLGSSCDTDEEEEEITKGFQVVGTLRGVSLSLSPALKVLPARSPSCAPFNDNPELCPDETGDGVSANLSPTDYEVALKSLILLGDSNAGTVDYEVFSANSVDEAYTVDFVNDTTFFYSESYPPAGTYNGIEIQVFYVEMVIPMIIPTISEAEEFYRTRGYFSQVGNLMPRDVTIFYDGSEYWINRKTDDPDPFGLVSITANHPEQVLDLWADESFWGRDPTTISTADPSFGTAFTFALAEGTKSFTIPANPTGLYEIIMDFNVANKFTFWEYLENGLPGDADGKFTVGYDCGYRIFFPDVVISIEE